jgi:hypothetical protein
MNFENRSKMISIHYQFRDNCEQKLEMLIYNVIVVLGTKKYKSQYFKLLSHLDRIYQFVKEVTRLDNYEKDILNCIDCDNKSVFLIRFNATRPLDIVKFNDH